MAEGKLKLGYLVSNNGHKPLRTYSTDWYLTTYPGEYRLVDYSEYKAAKRAYERTLGGKYEVYLMPPINNLILDLSEATGKKPIEIIYEALTQFARQQAGR